MGNPIKRIIYHLGKYPLMYLVAMQSYPLARQAAITPDKIILDKPYNGQPIMVIALYQQGKLRPDIARLLLMAKELGLYVIGVNNAHLSEPMQEHFDCYIERFNFGRDFASYKVGFEHVFAMTQNSPCPRLLMVNDSIYYDTTRLKPFLEHLIRAKVEVLGATENYEISHHVGSFCISIDGKILRQPAFQQYWAQYKNTDVRLWVIYRGEIGLSACLKTCVSKPDQFRAFYDLSFLEHSLADKKNFDAFIALARRGNLIAWPTLATSPSIPDIIGYTKHRSQIHFNNAYLLHMGLPIVKLDGYYRGVFSAEDVSIIGHELPPSEAQELKDLLLRRPYGLKNLTGWQKILFMWGLI